jgi:hypothetical protein
VTASLRALLAGIIDYAGLFPPARLPLDAAIRRFAVGRQGPDGWMLSRFIVQAARLGELTLYRDDLFSRSSPFPFSMLGRGGADAETLLAGLELDLADLEGFVKLCGDRAAVGALEFKLAPQLLDPPDAADLEKLFDRVAEMVDEKSPSPLTLYYEAPQGPDWRRSIAAIVGALAAHRARRAARPQNPAALAQDAGFKLRCGGVDASLIPPAEQLAFVVAACRDAAVPFKATAGLHRPVRLMDHELLAKTHGFLNLLGAAALAHARGLDEETLVEAVADEDPRAFVFEEHRLLWRDQEVSVDEIKRARGALVRSFGSCSFDDPRDGLTVLGLV